MTTVQLDPGDVVIRRGDLLEYLAGRQTFRWLLEQATEVAPAAAARVARPVATPRPRP